MDSLLSVPLLLSVFLCFLFIFVLLKPKKNHSWLPPGPRPLPIIGNIHHIIGSLPHHAMRDLSKQYGPLMLLNLGGPPIVVVSSPDAAREIIKTHDISIASRPGSTTIDIFTFGGKGIIFAPYGEYWRQIRKVCIQELLSIRRVQSYRSIREEEVGNLIKYLYSCAYHRQPVNLSKRLASTLFDITTRAIIGSKCKNQEMFLQELETAQNLVAGFNLTHLFPSSRLAKLVSRSVKMAERSHQAINHLLDEVIEQKKERKIATEESKEEDLLSILLRLHDEESIANPLDMETIKAVISDLFSAGSDTSSTTLEWAMSELLRNPTVLEKAQSEIRELLKGSTTVSESDIGKLQYLHLVLKETLRLHPPGPLFPRQFGEACRVFDYDIPKGTRIYVNAWAIGRDPMYWEDPEEFKPERFMNSTIDFKGTDFEYIPFGSGRRMCVGVSFGVATMSLVLANLLFHFDWKLCDGLKPEELDMSEFFGLSSRRKTPLLLYAAPHKTNTEIHE